MKVFNSVIEDLSEDFDAEVAAEIVGKATEASKKLYDVLNGINDTITSIVDEDQRALFSAVMSNQLLDKLRSEDPDKFNALLVGLLEG